MQFTVVVECEPGERPPNAGDAEHLMRVYGDALAQWQPIREKVSEAPGSAFARVAAPAEDVISSGIALIVGMQDMLKTTYARVKQFESERDAARTQLGEVRQQYAIVRRQLAELERQNSELRELAGRAADDDVLAELDQLRRELAAEHHENAVLSDLLAVADTELAAARAAGPAGGTTAEAAADHRPAAAPAPGSLGDVLHATTSPWLVVTADPAAAAALDSHPQAPSWRRRAADALATLSAYAHAKAREREDGPDRFGRIGSFVDYVRSGRDQVLIPAGRVVPCEGSPTRVNDRYVNARTFAVPEETRPGGKAVMEAHIRVGSGAPPAPRLHFLDDTDGPSGLVVVGYLGEHLPSTQTN